jgi:hypothetical protein
MECILSECCAVNAEKYRYGMIFHTRNNIASIKQDSNRFVFSIKKQMGISGML